MTEETKDELKLHPHFERSLEDIVEEICIARLIVEPALERMQTSINELQTYLKYEVDRVTLLLERKGWECRCDPDDRRAMMAWGDRLDEIRDLATVERLKASLEFLIELRVKLLGLRTKERAAEAAL